MSMISEQIEKLQLLSTELKDNIEYWHVISGGEAHNWQRVVDSAIATIKELSAKVASENMERSDRYYNGGWIPCSERLPELKTDVLIYTEYEDILTAYYDGRKWITNYIYLDVAGKVIAWMPLPEPYEEADNETD